MYKSFARWLETASYHNRQPSLPLRNKKPLAVGSLVDDNVLVGSRLLYLVHAAN